MTYILLGILLLSILILFFISVNLERKMRRKIHDRIIQDARSKNLNPVKIEYPKNADWTKWPFENRIRIGNSPFYGIPTNREFHRLLTSRKTSGAEEIWWVIATDRYKPRRIELEWKITSRKQAE